MRCGQIAFRNLAGSTFGITRFYLIHILRLNRQLAAVNNGLQHASINRWNKSAIRQFSSVWGGTARPVLPEARDRGREFET
jgi:hypothetical protein